MKVKDIVDKYNFDSLLIIDMEYAKIKVTNSASPILSMLKNFEVINLEVNSAGLIIGISAINYLG